MPNEQPLVVEIRLTDEDHARIQRMMRRELARQRWLSRRSRFRAWFASLWAKVRGVL